MRRIASDQVDWIVNDAARHGQVLGVRASVAEGFEEEEPWTLPPSRTRVESIPEGACPESVELVLGNSVYVPKAGLPEAMLNQVIRLAAFQNPEFYKTQAMRLSTWDKPRIISCAEEFAHHIALPRGCLQEVSELLKAQECTYLSAMRGLPERGSK